MSNYKNLPQSEAKKRLDNEDDIILLDVRTTEEFVEKHIPNSIHIPVDQVEKDAEEMIEDKDATIFVYCRSGRKSVAASETLTELGYSKVYNIGGIISWPYETVEGKR